MDAYLEMAKGIGAYKIDGFTLMEIEAEKDKILISLYGNIDAKTSELRKAAIKELFLMQAGLATSARFGRRNNEFTKVQKLQNRRGRQNCRSGY